MPASLGYDRIGSGPPLVLLHPLGADRHVWDRVAAELADLREVVTVDLPGFGASPPLSGVPTPAALAAAIAAFLSEQELDQPDVAGNSLGGWVALELALAGHVDSVTAIAPAGLWPRPLGPKPALARPAARLGRPLIGAATRSRSGRRLLLAGTVARPDRVSAEAAARLLRAYADAPDFSRVNAEMRSASFTRLSEIEVPVTLVWPEHDTVVSRPKHLPRQVVSVELPDTGHIPMLEAPEAVAELLVRTTAATASRRSAQRRAAR